MLLMKQLTILTTAAAGTAALSLTGADGVRPRLILAAMWCACMALDYLSGTAAAAKNGSWCSTTARQGLWHKGGMMLVVVVAALADTVLGSLGQQLSPALSLNLASGSGLRGILLPMVLIWYSITELGSVLENAVLLGAPVPGWLTRLLKNGLNRVDAAGSSAADADAAEGGDRT